MLLVVGALVEEDLGNSEETLRYADIGIRQADGDPFLTLANDLRRTWALAESRSTATSSRPSVGSTSIRTAASSSPHRRSTVSSVSMVVCTPSS